MCRYNGVFYDVLHPGSGSKNVGRFRVVTADNHSVDNRVVALGD